MCAYEQVLSGNLYKHLLTQIILPIWILGRHRPLQTWNLFDPFLEEMMDDVDSTAALLMQPNTRRKNASTMLEKLFEPVADDLSYDEEVDRLNREENCIQIGSQSQTTSAKPSNGTQLTKNSNFAQNPQGTQQDCYFYEATVVSLCVELFCDFSKI
jgi:hypothetical protein